MEKTLKDLKVGDVVAIWGGYLADLTIQPIKEITPKGFIKVHGTLFDPQSGKERTSNIYHCLYIKVPTQEEIDNCINKRRVAQLQQFIRDNAFKIKDLDKLIKIKDIICDD